MTQTAASIFPEGYPEPLEVIGNIAFEKLLEKNVDALEAPSAAFEIAERVRAELGGTAIYIARGVRLDGKKRKEIICQEFDGKNYAALARKHKVSDVHVRQIIKEAAKKSVIPLTEIKDNHAAD